jgi:ABC-2 type transport system permease protein
VLFIISGVGLGLLVSTFCRTQRQAQQITSLVNLLTMLLTGFLYPRSTMPLWTQVIGGVIPLTYFLRISRGIITRGTGMEFLWPDALALVAYSVAALGLAAAAFKTRLD